MPNRIEMFLKKSLLIISTLFVLSHGALTNFTLNCETLSSCEIKNQNCELFCKIPSNFQVDDELVVENVMFKGGENSGIELIFDRVGMTTTIPRDIGLKITNLR